MGIVASKKANNSLHIMKVTPESPADEAGLLPILQYVVGVEGEPVSSDNCILKIQSYWDEGKVALEVYDTRTKEKKEVEMKRKGSEKIGFSLKPHIGKMEPMIYKVLDLEKDQAAEKSGLIKDKDYIISHENGAFSSDRDMAMVLYKGRNKPCLLWVYNSDTLKVRKIEITPGENGFIGCDLGLGILNNIYNMVEENNGEIAGEQEVGRSAEQEVQRNAGQEVERNAEQETNTIYEKEEAADLQETPDRARPEAEESIRKAAETTAEMIRGLKINEGREEAAREPVGTHNTEDNTCYEWCNSGEYCTEERCVDNSARACEEDACESAGCSGGECQNGFEEGYYDIRSTTGGCDQSCAHSHPQEAEDLERRTIEQKLYTSLNEEDPEDLEEEDAKDTACKRSKEEDHIERITNMPIYAHQSEDTPYYNTKALNPAKFLNEGLEMPYDAYQRVNELCSVEEIRQDSSEVQAHAKYEEKADGEYQHLSQNETETGNDSLHNDSLQNESLQSAESEVVVDNRQYYQYVSIEKYPEVEGEAEEELEQNVGDTAELFKNYYVPYSFGEAEENGEKKDAERS